MAQPVGTLDAITPVAADEPAGQAGPSAEPQAAGVAGEGGGLPWWQTVPLVLLACVVLLRLRVLLRRRVRRRSRAAAAASVPRAAPGEDAGQPGTHRRTDHDAAHREGPARRPRRVGAHRHRLVVGRATARTGSVAGGQPGAAARRRLTDRDGSSE